MAGMRTVGTGRWRFLGVRWRRARTSALEDADGRPTAEVHDRDRHRYVSVERLAREDVDEAAVAELVGVDGDRAGLDELHRRPALELAVAEALEMQRAVGAHADRPDERGDEPPDRHGVSD